MFFKTIIIPLLVISSSCTIDGFLVHHQHHPHIASRISQPRFSSLSSLPGRSTRACSSLSSSMKNTNNSGSMENKGGKNQKGQNQKRKRRFAQEVEPIVSIQAPTPKRRIHDDGDEFGAVSSASTNKHDGNTNKNNRSNSKNPMLQNNKSIDELESIMSNRWGTRVEKWTANFDEWEIVYDDDNNNDSNSSKNSNHNENVSFKSDRKVRSKPVLNPWDKEEKQRLYNERERKKLERKNKRNNGYETQTNASVFQSAKDRQDNVLDRVRRNQERLKLQRDQDRGQGNNIVQINGYSREEDLEFYDEDDEGYEAPPSSFRMYSGDDDDDDDEELEGKAMNFYDNIISPKPVGGSGASSRKQSHAKSNDNGSSGGGFFFNEAAVVTPTATDNTNKGQQSPKQREKKNDLKKVVREPMLDSEGRKMYLTLEQATCTFDAVSNESGEEGALRDDELSWEDIGITNQSLQHNLNSMGCSIPLSVQDKACPSIVSGNDVLVSTHTGSGKTLAFLVPLAQRLLFNSESEERDLNLGVKVIIVAPGRELASQIVAVARDLFKGTELTAMLAIGGTPFSRNYEQIRKKKPTFLIGTPGRIAELVVGKPGSKSGKLKIASLQTIVLDECDALLEYEPHREPTAAIMDVLKRRHRDSLQSILCSATAGDLMATSKLDGYLRETFAHAQSDENDSSITAASNGEFSRTRVSRTAIHGVVHVQHKRFALDMLRKILYTEPSPQQVLVFVDNARRVGIVVDKLAEMGIIAAPLHGGQGSEKGDRAEVNKALREGFVGIVVATEMAARGIDAPYLTHVINLDLPTDASHYAHRAGRCGRGGRPGVVVNVAVGKREQGVPSKFAEALDINMYETEPQAGKLAILCPQKNK